MLQPPHAPVDPRVTAPTRARTKYQGRLRFGAAIERCGNSMRGPRRRLGMPVPSPSRPALGIAFPDPSTPKKRAALAYDRLCFAAEGDVYATSGVALELRARRRADVNRRWHAPVGRIGVVVPATHARVTARRGLHVRYDRNRTASARELHVDLGEIR